MVNMLLRVIHNQKIREGVYNSLVYSPVKSFFTFGYGGTESSLPDEIEPFKAENETDTNKKVNNDPNEYPGFEQRRLEK